MKQKFNYNPIQALADYVKLQGEQKTYLLPYSEPVECKHEIEKLTTIDGGYRCKCGVEFKR